jgi:DNA-binding XRE family transcriptional regulator
MRIAVRQVRTKLSPELVGEMFELQAQGWTQASLGDRFGVDRSTVSRALTRKHWPEVRAGLENPPAILSQAEAARTARAKLSAEQVRSVHRMGAEGMTQRAIGASIGISRPAVGYILPGETFRDIWLEFHGEGSKIASQASHLAALIKRSSVASPPVVCEP